MTGAIFCERRPATIIRSAWRGEGRKTSAPKRATSKREAAMDIISMAQQASPNPSGQREFLRAQLTALSSWVKRMPSSARTLVRSSGLSSVTLRAPFTLIGLFPALRANLQTTQRSGAIKKANSNSGLVGLLIFLGNVVLREFRGGYLALV